jgi:hypothetical protein
VPGSYKCVAPTYCKTAPEPPHFDEMQTSTQSCAAACVGWQPGIPGMGSVFYSGMQAGYACFCGTVEDGAKTVTDSNKAAFAECNNPCTYMKPGAAPVKTPAGLAGDTCGGGWLNEVVKVDLGLGRIVALHYTIRTHSLHTRFAKMFGASIPEATI